MAIDGLWETGAEGPQGVAHANLHSIGETGGCPVLLGACRLRGFKLAGGRTAAAVVYQGRGKRQGRDA